MKYEEKALAILHDALAVSEEGEMALMGEYLHDEMQKAAALLRHDYETYKLLTE